MKWGLAGYGRIARKFEQSIRHSTHHVQAIASKSDYHNIPKDCTGYNDYDDLFQDEEVDIIYVSTTHNYHAQLAIAALNAGKHVLCEKPLAISEIEVKSIIDAARINQRFLMEALWTRYLPGYRKVIELINDGVIGEVDFISAHFGFRMNPDDPKERLIKPELAAGAVWDVGIYPISLAQDIFQADPLKMAVEAKLSPYGTEDRCAMQFRYAPDKMAQLSCAIDLTTNHKAFIEGSKGRIEMDEFWKCEKFTLYTKEDAKVFHFPMTSTGLYHEAIACGKLINEGKIESDLISWDHSLQLARIMDEVISMARNQ